MEEQVLLHGIALANYKGIGAKTVFIAPFRKFNFFIGPNNAGKSCVLNFIAHNLEKTFDLHYNQNQNSLKPLDIYLGATPTDVTMAIGIPASELTSIIKTLQNIPKDEMNDISEIINLVQHNDSIWFTRDENHLTSLNPLNKENIQDNLHLYDLDTLGARIGKNASRVSSLELIKNIIDWSLLSYTPKKPSINLIPAIREISAKGENFIDWSGKGLIEEIARLQNPGVHNRQELQKFKRINSFLKTVTETENAEIEIPYDREHILVHMNGKTLPIESLGTGIHEVVMLAAFCTLAEAQIVCIEEPELHLHPILQRRLIKYLEENTTNQYFIATHSPSIIDTVDASIFHVSNIAGGTEINLCSTSNSRSNIIRDLGYKASDLLQSNAIIWVEGPSDRIYIKHWIKYLAPELTEGIDYSIMFYGGRLLSHLSANDSEINNDDLEAFISLRNLNRNLAVIMDSDKPSEASTINATKLRIKDEIEEYGGFAWITAGREIENYVPKDQMSSALSSIYKSFDKRYKTGQFDEILPFKTNDGKTFSNVDKIRIAKMTCRSDYPLHILDLKEQIEALITLIKHANPA